MFIFYFILYTKHSKKEDNYNDFNMQSLDSTDILYNYAQSISRNVQDNVQEWH